MAKRWRVVAGTLLLMCLAPPMVMAANESMVTLTLGRQTPTGGFGDVAKNGSTAAFSAGYRVTPWLAMGADFGYFRALGMHDGEALTVWEPTTEKNVDITLAENWSITEVGMYAKAYLYNRARVSPYLRGGAGAYTIRWSEDVKSATSGTTVGGSEEQSKFGVHGGAGLVLRISGGTTIGVESVVHCLFMRDSRVSMWLTGVSVGFGPAAK
jgi:opacity protein-like surface antigen